MCNWQHRMKGPEPPVAVVAGDKLYEAAITQDQELVQSAAICWDVEGYTQ